MKKKTIVCWIAFMCIVLLAGLPAIAQAGQGRGRLSGTVRDEAGSAIAGATVWLEFAEAGRRMEAETDGEGKWAFIGVGSGKARITVMAEGFQGVVVNAVVSQLRLNKPVVIVLKSYSASPLKAAVLNESPGPETAQGESLDLVTRTYTLKYVTPRFISDSLQVFLVNRSYGDGSNLITVTLHRKNIAAFEEQLRKLDVEKKNITLRIFTIVAAREGKSDNFENKDLKHVLAEVSNLLNFKSYVLDGASVVSIREGLRHGRLALSTSMNDDLTFMYSNVAIVEGSEARREVRLEFALSCGAKELLSSATEIAEEGYLVAGVSRIGSEGKSLVLVINAEIK